MPFLQLLLLLLLLLQQLLVPALHLQVLLLHLPLLPRLAPSTSLEHQPQQSLVHNLIRLQPAQMNQPGIVVGYSLHVAVARPIPRI